GPRHRVAARGASGMHRRQSGRAAGRRTAHREAALPGAPQGPARRARPTGVLQRLARDDYLIPPPCTQAECPGFARRLVVKLRLWRELSALSANQSFLVKPESWTRG